jgi:hypothetical protein
MDHLDDWLVFLLDVFRVFLHFFIHYFKIFVTGVEVELFLEV